MNWKNYKWASAVALIILVSSCKINEVPEETEYTLENEQEQITLLIQKATTAGYNVDTTANDLYYIILKPGAGRKVVDNDSLVVTYWGHYLNGDTFDHSMYYADDGNKHINGRFCYQHRVDRMIPGWEEGMELLNAGSEAVFIVPSALAYGISGNGVFPPYTPLVFELTLISINKKTN